MKKILKLNLVYGITICVSMKFSIILKTTIVKTSLSVRFYQVNLIFYRKTIQSVKNYEVFKQLKVSHRGIKLLLKSLQTFTLKLI